MSWKRHYVHLFISHVSPHRAFATELKHTLEYFGVDAFVAHHDIEPTAEWQRVIVDRLKTMDCLLAMLTDDFHESEWTDQEVGFALGRDSLVISLGLGRDPYGLLGPYQALQGVNKTPMQISNLIFDTLAGHPKTGARTARGAAELLYKSGSFAEAKGAMLRLERCRFFDQNSLCRMQAAMHDNGEVSAAWGVPDRINAIINKQTRPVRSPKPLTVNGTGLIY